MTTIYILLILWSGGDIDATHMVFGSAAFCKETLAWELAHPKGKVKEASCKPKRVKRGVPIQITDQLTFTPY
jgi:hypothetical protein